MIWIERAIELAEKAAKSGEVPVGAVLVLDNQIIAEAHNEVEKEGVATKHAEILCIERASKKLGNWRLSDTKLFVTLEPCPMCIGAILLSRISELYFGCFDSKMGAVGSLFDISSHPDLPGKVKVYSGIEERACSSLLSSFFKQLR